LTLSQPSVKYYFQKVGDYNHKVIIKTDYNYFLAKYRIIYKKSSTFTSWFGVSQKYLLRYITDDHNILHYISSDAEYTLVILNNQFF